MKTSNYLSKNFVHGSSLEIWCLTSLVIINVLKILNAFNDLDFVEIHGSAHLVLLDGYPQSLKSLITAATTP